MWRREDNIMCNILSTCPDCTVKCPILSRKKSDYMTSTTLVLEQFLDLFSMSGNFLAPPPKKKQIKRVPLMMKNMKNCPKAVFDRLKEASWCTECSTKTIALYKVCFFEKKSEKPKFFLMVFVKDCNFFLGFLKFFFKETILCKQLVFFALHSAHQDASCELSKTAFDNFHFFHHKEAPFWFGGGGGG